MEKRPYERPKVISKDTKTNAAEEKQLADSNLIKIGTDEEMREVVAQAQKQNELALAAAEHFLGEDQLEKAALVCFLRCHRGYSWRVTAGHLFLRWISPLSEEIREHVTTNHGWDPASNQLFGMQLCRRAARLLKDNPDEPPWN